MYHVSLWRGDKSISKACKICSVGNKNSNANTMVDNKDKYKINYIIVGLECEAKMMVSKALAKTVHKNFDHYFQAYDASREPFHYRSEMVESPARHLQGV